MVSSQKQNVIKLLHIYLLVIVTVCFASVSLASYVLPM